MSCCACHVFQTTAGRCWEVPAGHPQLRSLHRTPYCLTIHRWQILPAAFGPVWRSRLTTATHTASCDTFTIRLACESLTMRISGSRKCLVSITSGLKWKQTPLRATVFPGVHNDNTTTSNMGLFKWNLRHSCRISTNIQEKNVGIDARLEQKEPALYRQVQASLFSHTPTSCVDYKVYIPWPERSRSHVNRTFPWKPSRDTNTGCHWRHDYFFSLSTWVIFSFMLRACQSVTTPPPPPPSHTSKHSQPRHWVSLMLTCHIWKLFRTCAAWTFLLSLSRSQEAWLCSSCNDVKKETLDSSSAALG